MSRPLTPASRASLFAQETDETFILLLTFTHSDLETPLRVCSDTGEVVSRGGIYVPYPFDLSLPDDGDGKSPRAHLVIDNIDRQIMAMVRSLATSPKLTIEVVRKADPDTVEAAFQDFRLSQLRYDSQTISADLTIEDFTAEPYPSASFTPNLFPGMF